MSIEVLKKQDAREDFTSSIEEMKNFCSEMEEADVQMIPQTKTALTDEKMLASLQKTLDLLDDNDDVQNVYTNLDDSAAE